MQTCTLILTPVEAKKTVVPYSLSSPLRDEMVHGKQTIFCFRSDRSFLRRREKKPEIEVSNLTLLTPEKCFSRLPDPVHTYLRLGKIILNVVEMILPSRTRRKGSIYFAVQK